MEDKVNAFVGEAPIGKLITRYCIPCVISLLVAALYNIVDQLFIANADYLGSYGNSANSVVFPLTILALGLGMLIGDGGCTIASRELGGGQREHATKIIGTSVTLIVIVGIVLMAIFLIIPDQIITLFGGRVNETTFSMAKEYFLWISLGIPFYVFSQAMNPIIRADGSPRFAMVILFVGSLINVILDPIFIYVFKWGMFGAALATILGQIFSGVVFAVYCFRMKSVKLDLQSLRPRFNLLKEIIPQGFASFMVQVSIVISMAIVFRVIEAYVPKDPVYSQEGLTQIPTAVVGIAMKFFQVAISVPIGLATGCFSLAAYNMGAHKYDRVRRLMWRLLIIQLIYGAVMSVIFLAFPEPLTMLFGGSLEGAEYIQYSILSIRIFNCAMVLASFNKGVGMYQQAIGNSGTASAYTFIRELFFGTVGPIALAAIIGLNGVLWFNPASDVVMGIVGLFIALRTDKKLRQMEQTEARALNGTD